MEHSYDGDWANNDLNYGKDKFRYTPNLNQYGEYGFTFIAFDGIDYSELTYTYCIWNRAHHWCYHFGIIFY